MKISYLPGNSEMMGSAIKYPAILSRRHRFVDLTQADVALVRGDHRDDWKKAHAAGVPWVVMQHDCYSLRHDCTEEQWRPLRLRGTVDGASVERTESRRGESQAHGRGPSTDAETSVSEDRGLRRIYHGTELSER